MPIKNRNRLLRTDYIILIGIAIEYSCSQRLMLALERRFIICSVIFKKEESVRLCKMAVKYNKMKF